jgi:hypothetical protein
MAVRLGLYPDNLGKNQLYMAICDSFRNDCFVKWRSYDLIQQFDNQSLDEVLKYGYLVPQRGEAVVLSPTIPGTLSEIILSLLKSDIITTKELHQQLPAHMRVSSQLFKNELIFLTNLHLIQVATLPASGITYVALDGPQWIEDDLDRIYTFSDHIEMSAVYIPDHEVETETLIQLSEQYKQVVI